MASWRNEPIRMKNRLLASHRACKLQQGSWFTEGMIEVGQRLMAGERVRHGLWHEFRAKGPFDSSLGQRPGNAPGVATQPNRSRAPTARFIAFDKYSLGGAISCS